MTNYTPPVNKLTVGDEVAYVGKIEASATSTRIYDLKEKTTYRITVRGTTELVGFFGSLGGVRWKNTQKG